MFNLYRISMQITWTSHQTCYRTTSLETRKSKMTERLKHMHLRNRTETWKMWQVWGNGNVAREQTKSAGQHDGISIAPKSSSIYKSGFGLYVQQKPVINCWFVSSSVHRCVCAVLKLTYVKRLYRYNKWYVCHAVRKAQSKRYVVEGVNFLI